ncbi:hypothetical protein E5676_scaffold606G00730 [Cucumis melo var. makuwa]|uniref:Uncharacterized protein n=1 Tax=Cucumis melo var. makuwa TaxID=1194695 RepID=A0A5D3C7Q1_CUCMM|nr:hypothetical protein E5676_scaffold606G00730 [Cucumis melo var. makuwa]
MDFRLDDIEFKMNCMDSILDRMGSSFVAEFSAIKKLLMVLVKTPMTETIMRKEVMRMDTYTRITMLLWIEPIKLTNIQ